MAIGYARIEFVKRSGGKTACAKAAYNSKQVIDFQGNKTMGPDVYDWSAKVPPSYHEILLPSNVDLKFKSPQILWNAVEASEKKINSNVATELLLALPDDKIISLDDRVSLAKSFVQTHFIDKGLAAQIDIHPPERKIQVTQNDHEKGLYKGMAGNIIEETADQWTIQFDSSRIISFNPKEFTGFIEKENNWHAHVLITTRRFQSDGLNLGEKARDLMPRICNGKVISGPDWGKLWTDHQNQFFNEKGLNLRVDSPGIQPQNHLGPVRMRGRAFALVEEHGRLIEQNEIKAKDPVEILEKLTERQSVFTKEDLNAFLQKHVPYEYHTSLSESFWAQNSVIPLLDKGTGEITGKFSSKKVITEENQILRLADRIYAKDTFQVENNDKSSFVNNLNAEQKQAFEAVIRGEKLVCLQGYAGTGKSHLLSALKDLYSQSGITVRGFGPDSATADILKEKGFQNAENIYRFLFGVHNDKRKIDKGNEVWVLDEAGKLGNRPLLELLKEADKQNVKVILSGDHAQLCSVERGGMFQTFCERYGPLILKNIQRQKDEKQRDISLDLASGDVSTAIDKLSSSTIRWSATKKEVIEELIAKWAIDTRSSPSISTLIIAHTNDDVRLLNEMVRIVKRQRGDLSDKEYECETSFGKIYVSAGDRIEFRKNDTDIGVTNGLAGTLLEAKPNKFTISIEGKDKRIVTFNPKEYHAYQLGYASTYFRSQGRTVDKAYVLHSPALNKRLFYVGLTRHVDEAYYFVSKEQAYCLADLKRQASRQSNKANTLGFSTHQEIQAGQEAAFKRSEIDRLTSSDSFIEKIKGYGLAAYDLVKLKSESLHQRYQDRSPTAEFFHLKPQVATNTKADVSELAVNQALKTVLSLERGNSPQPEKNSMMSNVGHQSFNKNPEQLFKSCQVRKSNIWDSFTPKKQDLLLKYFSTANQASILNGVVEIEASAANFATSAHFKEWQVACGNRNSSAYDLTGTLLPEELTAFLGKKAAEFIKIQALRYQDLAAQNEKSASVNLELNLQENIEPLLYRLFPEGPFRKEKGSFRFGAKGSLSVIHSGDKVGQFYDFEKQEGGGMLKLVQRELGLGRLESLQWAKEFLGVSQDIKVPKTFLRGFNGASKEVDWVSVKPDSKVSAPSLELVGNKKLHYYFNETSRHPYQDENGQLLYYCLRLVDKNDPTKKMTPPLSYGYWKSDPTNLRWELKGFSSDKSILYNLPDLKRHPLATVLVVEGEKTADRALDNFPHDSFICVTWPGGAGAARRADWAPLIGRNVLVWPDNDKAGLQAGETVCQELRKVGIQSLKMIDPSMLSKHFPEKWDLADPIPSNLDKGFLQNLLTSSLQKGIDPGQVAHRVSSLYSSNDAVDKTRINEILWRVDNRMRPELEQKFGSQYWKINESISVETARLLLQQGQVQKNLKSKMPANEATLAHLSWQSLVYEANYGRSPAQWEIDKMQEVIQKIQSPKNTTDMQLLSSDKAFTVAYEKTMTGKQMPINELQQEIAAINESLEKRLHKSHLNEQCMQKDLGKDPALVEKSLF